MKAAVTAVDPAERAPGQASVPPFYLETRALVERLHRRLLNVIKAELASPDYSSGLRILRRL